MSVVRAGKQDIVGWKCCRWRVASNSLISRNVDVNLKASYSHLSQVVQTKSAERNYDEV